MLQTRSIWPFATRYLLPRANHLAGGASQIFLDEHQTMVASWKEVLNIKQKYSSFMDLNQKNAMMMMDLVLETVSRVEAPKGERHF